MKKESHSPLVAALANDKQTNSEQQFDFLKHVESTISGRLNNKFKILQLIVMLADSINTFSETQSKLNSKRKKKLCNCTCTDESNAPQDKHSDEIKEIIANSTCALTALIKTYSNYLETRDFTQNEADAMEAGIQIGYIMGLKDSLNRLPKTMASIAGKLSIKKGRWNKVSDIKARLVVEAEKRWKAGSNLLHNDMADTLLSEDKEAKEYVKRMPLVWALKETAKRYGKLRGEKGVRKGKLPT